MHKPYFRECPDSNIAFLFVHGILSSPRHFDWMIQQLPQKYTVSNILLTGHGGNVDDFSRATMKQWKEQFDHALSKLEKPGRRIIVVGHSLGSLLALQALKKHDSIYGLILLNPPLKPQLKLSMMWRSIRFAFGKVNNSPEDVACYEDLGISLEPHLWKYIKWIPNFISLLFLAYRCKPIPHTLSIPCYAFLGNKDELVNLKSVRYLQNNSQITVTVFPNGNHFGVTDAQKEQIYKQISVLIQTIEKQK